MAGLSCAQELVKAGREVRVFDKGRGPGGRMSTRRMQTPIGEIRWDHGAQFFTARDDGFRSAVTDWMKAGAVSEWHGTFLDLGSGTASSSEKSEPRYVGVPGMNGVIRHMAENLTVQWARRARTINGIAGEWNINFEDQSAEGPFEWIIVAVPAEQAVDLLQPIAPMMAAEADTVRSAPCWAVLLAYDEPLAAGFDGARISGAPLSWIARNTSKPGRGKDEAWVLHASPDWSREHVDEDKDEIAAKLIRNFRAMSDAPEPIFSAAHRWLYAMIEGNDQTHFFGRDDAKKIGACGDWFIGPRVESAWVSGARLADHILKR